MISSFAKIAELVAGQESPAWLTEYFASWAPCVSLDQAVHARQPTKVCMSKRLVTLRKTSLSALAALEATEDLPTAEFIRIEGGGTLNSTLLKPLLTNVAAIAAEAIASPALSDSTGKPKAGRGRALPHGAISSKLFCTVIVLEPWAHFRGQYPVKTDKEAAAAIQAYWDACGGRSAGWSHSRIAGWKHYVARLQQPMVASIRAECQRHVREHTCWQAVLMEEH